MVQIVLIALGLSMDAFAVSVSSGICTRDLPFRCALRGAFFFGFFQFAMPLAGWFLGSAFRDRIEPVDHWIVFALLAFIGGKMVWESLKPAEFACADGEEPAVAPTDVRDLRNLLVLSLATSIDALAVGLSLSILNTPVWGPASLIGGVTFALCLAGFEFGKRIGYLIERRAETLGGMILIAIGVKILIEHLF